MISMLQCAGVTIRFRYDIVGRFSVLMTRKRMTTETPLGILAPGVHEFFQSAVEDDEGWRNMIRFFNSYAEEFAVHFSKLSLTEQAAALTPNGFVSFRGVAAKALVRLEERRAAA